MARPRKYPIHELEVGQSIILPWGDTPHFHCVETKRKMATAIYQEARRYNKRFKWSIGNIGLTVTRYE